jgi:hypothetical protein
MASLHNLILRINKKNNLTIYVRGFGLTISWIVTLRQRILMTANAIFVLAMTLTLRVKKIKFTISATKLLQRITLSLIVKRIRLTASLKQIMSFVLNIIIRQVITVSLHQILRVTGISLRVRKILLTANVLIARFYLVSYFDPYYLSDYDNTYLSDMDYVISP